MEYKVTGLVRNGLYDHDNKEWVLARITPRFFPSENKALQYFNNEIVKGAVWRRANPKTAGEYERWNLRRTRGMDWPEGARGL